MEREANLDRHDQVLLGLVASLQAAGMQQLGKLVHPLTGKVERDLEQARATIDLLEMLKAKCAGATPPPVMRVLGTTLMELQMNWLDEARREQAPAAGPEAGAPAGSPPTDAPPPEAPPAGEGR